MKKTLLAFAVGAAVAAPSAALANAQLYGKINLSVDKYEPSGIDHQWELNSNKSYLGVRGGADLDFAGLRGIYQLEFGVNVDDADGAETFTSRDSFVGLEGGFGTVKAGRFDTPLRSMGVRVDEFNDQTYADIDRLVAGEWRASNIIQYSTPRIADSLTVNVATIASEGSDVNDSGNDNTGLFDSYSASIMFDQDMIFAGVGYDHNNFGSNGANGIYRSLSNSALAGNSTDIIRVVGGADLDVVRVGVLLQEARTRQDVIGGDKEKERSWLLSGAVPLGMITLKAQYGETDPKETDDAKVRQYSLGADYALGEQTHTYIYSSNREVDGDRNYAVIGIGAEHRF